MKTQAFKTGVVFLGFIPILLTVWLGGCASTPPERRPDNDKIKQDSEKSMQGLKEEEDRRRGNGY